MRDDVGDGFVDSVHVLHACFVVTASTIGFVMYASSTAMATTTTVFTPPLTSPLYVRGSVNGGIIVETIRPP